MNSTATSLLASSAALEDRILREGYGSEAWHGPDLKAAVSNIATDLAFWRPGAGRHNIAEIAVHHAFYIRAVRGRLLGTPPDKFILEGEDWFPLSTGSLAWTEILQLLDSEQRKLVDTVSRIGDGRATSPLSETEQLDVVLGITCHAVYHAGQIQLIKVLKSST